MYSESSRIRAAFYGSALREGISRFDGVGDDKSHRRRRFAESFCRRFSRNEKWDDLHRHRQRLGAAESARTSRVHRKIRCLQSSRRTIREAETLLTLFEDKNNQVWVGTSDGLYKLIEAGGQVQFEFVPLGEPCLVNETIYINERSSTTGAARCGSRRRPTVCCGSRRTATCGVGRSADKLPENNIASLLEDRDGKIWAGFRRGAAVCAGSTAQRNRLKNAIQSKTVCQRPGFPICCKRATEKYGWRPSPACVNGNRKRAARRQCVKITRRKTICATASNALAEDKDGNLWTGADCGAKKIARYGFTTYTAADGLGASRINSIFETAAGDFVVSTSNRRGISRFDGEKFSPIQPPLPKSIGYFGWGWQQTVWQDSRGAWWIPTGGGLFRSPDSTNFDALAGASLEKLVFGAKGVETFRLFEDSRGDVWAAIANNEIWRWERAANRWHDYTAQAGLSSERLVSAFAEDRSGNVWIGTGSDDTKEINEGLLLRWNVGSGQFRRFTHR